MNVLDEKNSLRNCTSCGFCAAVCPKDAITIKLNQEGFYRPVIDELKCVNCSRCIKYCYRFDPQIKYKDIGSAKLYSSVALNEECLKNTTSGGVADVLARHLIKMGYTCIGVVYDSVSNRAIGRCAENIDQVKEFRGSKYIQSYSVDAFRWLVKNNRHKLFAVFGLPCHIYAISQFMESINIRQNNILVDLYCHGCPTMNLWDKYISESIGNSQVISANFRSKRNGWGRFCIDLETENKSFYSNPGNDPFYTLFFSDWILNDACSDCLLRSSLSYTDIRLGDYWGRRYLNNKTGVSAVTVCTERGQSALLEISPLLKLNVENFSNFLPYQSVGKTYSFNPEYREKLLSLLADKKITLKEIVKTYSKFLGFKGNVIRILKNLIKRLPLRIENYLKKICK